MSCTRASLVLIAGLTFALSACQKNAPEASQAADVPAVNDIDEDPAVIAGPISAEPAELSSCDGSVVTLRWDISEEHPDVEETEIMTGAANGELTLFAAGTQRGEAQTGNWSGPGSIFAIRDKTTGQELARTVIGGPDCP